MHTIPPPPPGQESWRAMFASPLAQLIHEHPDQGIVIEMQGREIQRLSYAQLCEYAAKEQANQDAQAPPLSVSEWVEFSGSFVGSQRLCDRLRQLIDYLITEETKQRRRR